MMAHGRSCSSNSILHPSSRDEGCTFVVNKILEQNVSTC